MRFAETNVTCGRAADIVLVLDQSTSIVSGYPNYDNWYVQVLGFAKRIAGAFPIGSNLTQIGLMKFSTEEEIVFHLNAYGDRESLLNAIDNVDIYGGDTNIAAALRTARQEMFTPSNGARPGVPKLLILVTDGTANIEPSNTLIEADLAKADDIIIYTVGVTDEVDEDQLKEIATTPEYFFFASNFEQLNSVLQYLVENSCKEAATLPTTTTTTTAPTTYTTTTTMPTTTTLQITTTSATIVNVTCTGVADMVLVLDQSTSIVVETWDNWYVQVLGFAKRIAGSFPIDRNLTQIGLLKFSTDVEIVFHLNTYGDRESLLNAIDNVDISGGDTNIAAALRTARQEMFTQSNGARPGVPKILILVTDGTANIETSNTVAEADLAKADDIIIYTVGVTNEVDEDQLREIASTLDYFFFASNFEQLNSILQDLVENSCKEVATLPTTTTSTTPAATTSTTTTSTATTTTPTTTITTTTTTTTPTTTATTATASTPSIMTEGTTIGVQQWFCSRLHCITIRQIEKCLSYRHKQILRCIHVFIWS